jgi:hypothetical protein
MKVTADRGFAGKWIVILLSLAGVGWLGVPHAHAAKILFIVSQVDADGTANSPNDEEVVTRLQGKGHTVTIADDQDTTLDSFLAGQDLILISSSVGSGSQPLNGLALDPLKTGATPVICYEPGLWDELGFQTLTTSPGYGNAGGHTSLAIHVANQSHPLAAGKSGTVSMVTSGTANFSSSDLPVIVGDDAIKIASTAANAPAVDLGRLAIWAYDIDDRLVDNTTTVPSRRVAFFFNATTAVGVYNTNAYDLFFAAVNWALAIGATNEPPRIKNLLPANETAFAPLNQGVSFAVKTISPNSIPTGNIRLVLNGTDVSSALAISGTTSNRTVNWPGPLAENTLYTGQITASDNAGRSTIVTWTFDTLGTVRPRPNAVGVNPATDIFVELVDQNRQVNTNSITLSINDSPAQATVSKAGTRTTLSYDPPGLLPSNSTNEVKLVFGDTLNTLHTNIWRFFVLNYSTFPVIPPESKVPPATVDLNRKGFLLKLRQMEVARPGANNLPAPLIQLNDGFIDPLTGQPYVDQIDRTQAGGEPGSIFNADGSFSEVGAINYNEEALGLAAEQGVFRAPDFPDKPIPGAIQNATAANDIANNIAMLAVTILDLKSGVYRFAVNSDDGFLFTLDNPFDAFANRLSVVDGGRGQASTFFDFLVNEDGFYPFNLVWWEGDGDSEVEFFSVDPITGTNILVNYTTNPSAIRAYRPASIAIARPYVRSINPPPGAVGVVKTTTIDATLVDGTASVNTNSIRLLLNGTPTNPSITKTGAVTTVNYDPPGDLPALSSNLVTLIFADNGSPVIARTNSWSFTAESALPKALFLVGTPGAPNASETAIRNRLQSEFGFEANFVDDDSAVPANANFAALIVVSSTVGSGNITKYRDVSAPIIDWEWAAFDGLALTAFDGQSLAAGQTNILITNATHPLAAGFPAGDRTLFSTPAAQMAAATAADLAASVTVVATAADGSGNPVLFAAEKGAALQPDPISGAPVTAAARRTGIFLGGDTFTVLNADGLTLFDAAVRWTANLSAARPTFNPPVLSGGSLSLSWTGTGTLQVATNLTGNSNDWSNANPQPTNSTFSAQVGSTPRSFYRISQ